MLCSRWLLNLSQGKIVLENNVVACKTDLICLVYSFSRRSTRYVTKKVNRTTTNCQLYVQMTPRPRSQSVWVTLKTSDHQFPELGLQLL